MKNMKLKFILPAIAMLMVMAVVVPGTTEGGKKWSGVDPIFLVNGEQFNVWIEWPEGYGCSITEPIEIDLMVPKNTSYVFMSESSEDADGCGFPQLTETKAKFTGSNGKVKFVAKVDSEEDFPVRMKVYFKGELVRTYEGDSNEGVTGKPFTLPGIDSEGDDHGDDGDDDDHGKKDKDDDDHGNDDD